MKVYVETNFLIELTLAQEERQSCEKILSICKNGSAKLLLPAYSFPEAYNRLARRRPERMQLSNQLGNHLAELRRSSAFDQPGEFAAVQNYLTTISDREQDQFHYWSDRLLGAAEIIPLSREIFNAAGAWQRSGSLELPDSLIFASILAHLKNSNGERACFVSRDDAFTSDPDVRSELRELNCEVKARFDAAVSYIRSRISAS